MEGSYLLNSELAERLCRRISDTAKGKVVSLADRETASDNRNLYRVLLTDDGKKLLSCAATNAHFLSERYSDYENFVELLNLLPSLVGSGYHSFVRLFLEYLLDLHKPPTPCDAKRLWMESLSLLAAGSFDRFSEPFLKKRAMDLTSWVFPTADDLYEYETAEVYLSALRSTAENNDLLRIDLSSLEFVPPDPYHAEKGFSAVKEGRSDSRDRVYLISQILRVMGEICKARNIPLILSGVSSCAEMKSLFSYLERVDRMPRVYYAMPFDCSTSFREILSELDSSEILSVLSGIVPTALSVSSSDSIDTCLALLATYYPFGRLSFVAESKTDVEMRFEYERFLRMLASRLSSSVLRGELSEADAVTVGTNIVTSAALF